MLSIDHNETPYDLNFRIGSTHVRVHPFFWLTSILLGWFWFDIGGISYLLMWVGCTFVSVLLHELGHVWMGMAFGTRGHIVLWSFGGVAIGSNQLESRWQRIAVSLAGPGIQFALYGVLRLSLPWIFQDSSDVLDISWLVLRANPRATLFVMLLWINLFWPLLNLLPIWPLDGGMVTRELCVAASRQKGVETSLLISIGMAGILAIHCLMASNGRPLIPYLAWFGGTFMAIFFAMDCVQCIQLYQQERARRNPWDDDLPWER